MHGEHECQKEARVLSTAQQQTGTGTAKQLREDNAGDAKDTRPLHTTLCKHSKKPQAHPSLRPYRNAGLDLHNSLDRVGFIT